VPSGSARRVGDRVRAAAVGWMVDRRSSDQCRCFVAVSQPARRPRALQDCQREARAADGAATNESEKSPTAGTGPLKRFESLEPYLQSRHCRNCQVLTCEPGGGAAREHLKARRWSADREANLYLISDRFVQIISKGKESSTFCNTCRTHNLPRDA
jgi:hypothetical protein